MNEILNNSPDQRKLSRHKETIDMVLDDLSLATNRPIPDYTLREVNDSEKSHIKGVSNILKSEIALSDQDIAEDGQSISAHEAAHIFISRTSSKYLDFTLESIKQLVKLKDTLVDNENYDPEVSADEYLDFSMYFIVESIYAEMVANYIGYIYGHYNQSSGKHIENDFDDVFDLALQFIQTTVDKLEDGELINETEEDDQLADNMRSLRFVSSQIGTRLGRMLYVNTEKVNLKNLLGTHPMQIFKFLVNSSDDKGGLYTKDREEFVKQLIQTINIDK